MLNLFKINLSIIIGAFSIILLSCSSEPREIDYGKENCNFCSMTIMDKQFGSESMTKKGKIFTFCSIECMLWDYEAEKSAKKGDFELLLAKDFVKPNEFKNVNDLFFVVSKDIPSPMGASLSAYDSQSKAEDAIKNKEGKIYKWNELSNIVKR